MAAGHDRTTQVLEQEYPSLLLSVSSVFLSSYLSWCRSPSPSLYPAFVLSLMRTSDTATVILEIARRATTRAVNTDKTYKPFGEVLDDLLCLAD